MPKASNDQKPWSLSYNSSSKSGKVIGSAVSEPKHRIGPEGVSSGLSLREFPKSCIEEVKNICLHYVDKCSGKYENNQAAARYVHQMADEIIKQLAGVAAQIQWHEQEPKIYETLLNEWNEFFPSSLGVYGTPKAIHLKLNSQNRELESLRMQVEHLNSLRKRDMNDTAKAIDVQIHAARVSGIHERRVMLSTQENQRQEYEKLLSEEREKHVKIVQDLIVKASNEERNVQSIHEQQQRRWQVDMNRLKEDFDSYRENMENKIKSIEKKWEEEKSLLNKEKYELLDIIEAKDHELQELLHYEDSQSLSTAAATVESENDNDIRGEEKTSNKEGLISRKLSKLSSKSRKTDGSPLDTYKSANKDPDAFGSLDSSSPSPTRSHRSKFQMQMKSLHDGWKAEKKLTIELEEHLRVIVEERDYLLKIVEALKKLNQELQLSISTQLRPKGFERNIIEEKPFVLTHTPHFLGYDRAGLHSSQPKMSAYNSAGIF